MKLYGCKGCGSALIEAVLLALEEPCEVERFAWEDNAAWLRLQAINPWRQVPTLVLDDGQVLTESVAIVLWLVARHPESTLAPAPGSPAHAAWLRWMIYLTANVYAPIGMADFPERWIAGEAAGEALIEGAAERVKAAWQVMEATLAPAPFLFGGSLTALDIYVALLTRWRPPGRAWFEAHTPRVMEAVRATEAQAIVRRVWEANF